MLRRIFKRFLQAIAISLAVIIVWNFEFPYIGKYWFRQVIASGGEADGLSYAVEAYRFQGSVIFGIPDAGFKLRIGSHKFYDETDYQIDFSNLRANRIEFARISGDNLYMSIHYTRFEDSLSGNGTYRLLFNRKSGGLRTCQSGRSAIPAEHDCDALTIEAKRLLP